MLRGWADMETSIEQRKQLDDQKLEQLNEIASEAMELRKRSDDHIF